MPDSGIESFKFENALLMSQKVNKKKILAEVKERKPLRTTS